MRCTDGGLKRLQVRFADSAGFSRTTIEIGAAGGAVAGDTLHYQLWYRSTTAPPCGPGVHDFNTSNGYVLTWGP